MRFHYWKLQLAGADRSPGRPAAERRQAQACCWIIDKWGVRWQVVPSMLGQMITDRDKTKAKRVAEDSEAREV